MLKTTLQIVNGSNSKVNCISVGATIRVPALSTITKVVNESAADAIISALATKYPSLVITDQGDYDDGVAYPYMPFAKNKLIATTAPGVTNDTTEGYSIGSIWIDTTASPRAVYQCVDSATDAAIWKNLTLDDQPFAEKTPVNAVAASGTLTVTSGGARILDGDKVTIATKIYTFKDTIGTTEGNVFIGANDTAALANLIHAINHTGTPNTSYYCAAVHPTVAGTSSDATTAVVTAKTSGVAGNAIATTDTEAGVIMAWGAATLAGGINGTVGVANETCADASYLYHCIAANTIADANWRRVSLGSVY